MKVTDSSLTEVMDDKIVKTLRWSFKNRTDNAMSCRLANEESKLSGQETQGALKLCCHYDGIEGDT